MNEQDKTKALMEFLYKDFQHWKQQQLDHAHALGQQIWGDIDEKQYCSERLHVPYESFNRWKNRNTPVSEINLLRIAISLGDEEPLRIYGFDPLPRDLWDILVRLPQTQPEDRKAIRRIVTQTEDRTNVMVAGD